MSFPCDIRQLDLYRVQVFDQTELSMPLKYGVKNYF